MKASAVVQAWGRILRGHLPALSIEITRECPLSCPGCYAYGEDHLGGGNGLLSVADYRGSELVDGIMRLVDQHNPLHLSLVGGEPLVRHRELTELLPRLERRGIHVQIVTSAVRPIPQEWRGVDRLSVVVSIDGLQPEHDERRKPATYERILNHIQGHSIAVHCTVTGQMTRRPGYMREFLSFWSEQPAARAIWISLFTPQVGETGEEVIDPVARTRVLDQLRDLRPEFPKLVLPDPLIEGFRRPPAKPDDCIFARTTKTYTADLEQLITPCQFGGEPDCSQCGCLASAALTAVGRKQLPGGIRIGSIYETSHSVGQFVAACTGLRNGKRGPASPLIPDPASD